MSLEGCPSIPGLMVYVPPQSGRRFVLGIDPAGGGPHSDESAVCVMDVDSGEECALLAGRIEPVTLAANADAVGQWYNNAAAMIERREHGWAVILWFQEHSRLDCMNGFDGKPGWHTTVKGKPMLMDEAGEALRDGDVIIHDPGTYAQMSSIEGSTLKAPDSMHDDRALAFCLANSARRILLHRRVDVHKLMDNLIEVFQGKKAPVDESPLPATEVGGVEWVASFDEFFVYRTTVGGKLWIFSSRLRDEALYAARLIGVGDFEGNSVTPERQMAIREIVKSKCP